MYRFNIHRVLTIVFCVAASMVRSAENGDMPREILPLAAEPEFEFLEYSDLPRNVQMVVKMSTQDVWGAFMRRYPAAHKDSLTLRIYGENVIKSGELYFRRVSLFLEDSENRGPHGACGQPAAIWFTPKGEVREIYVNEPACPV